MSRRKRQKTALTIAGSDSGGGAGIQADLKTFAALGLHGTSALTCLTAQNPRRVTGIQPASPEMVRRQMHAIFEAFSPAAIKTGMLYSKGIIEAVAEVLPKRRCPPLVIDPVMVASSGVRLLRPDAVRALTRHLLPRATLITPNLDEAGLLLNRSIKKVEHLRQAARDLQKRFQGAVLVKGGDLRGVKSAVDFFFDGTTELLLEAPLIRGVSGHGTGCTYAAAVTGYLALGVPLTRAVERAKQFITQAIAGARRADGHDVLAFFSKLHRA
jgi:hydroxymethylpyrimidine/phosphomethylpyrimidine kinase